MTVKKETRGRKKIGETRKVSVTMPVEFWEIADSRNESFSEQIRQLYMEKYGQTKIDDYISC